MPLPPPAPRADVHLRRVTYRGFAREDGQWDIEGELKDTKAYELAMRLRGPLPAGEPIHHMSVRVTIDDAMNITDIVAVMDSVPFDQCQHAAPPVHKLIGATLGPGWRRAIDAAIGGTHGCTHMRELLFGIATCAFQSMGSYREHLRVQRGEPPLNTGKPPHYMGKCMTWDFNGPLVAQIAPEFVGWEPVKQA